MIVEIMENQEKQKHHSFITQQELKTTAKKKSIMVGILFGLFIPIAILELTKFSHSLEYPVRFFIGALILMPIITSFMFFYLQKVYKCPRCKTNWSYQKIGETIIESFVTPSLKKVTSESNNVRNERYLTEFECSECHYKNYEQKKRKIIEKSE